MLQPAKKWKKIFKENVCFDERDTFQVNFDSEVI